MILKIGSAREPKLLTYLTDKFFLKFSGWDKYSVSGLPMPLPDKPLITLMSDTHVTLTWKPSIPMGPNLAPYYVVEMAEYPDGDWMEVYEECRGITWYETNFFTNWYFLVN